MKIYRSSSLKLSSSVLVIGAFDGVHKGHQKLIESAKYEAEKLHVPLVAYTFDPPPRVYFQKKMQLVPLEEKLNRLYKMGVNHTIVATFNAEYAALSTEHFYKEIKRLNPLHIWVGKDFRFGAGRKGDISSLQQHFTVHSLDPICCSEGEIISSTRIRQLISQNMKLEAQQLLGW